MKILGALFALALAVVVTAPRLIASDVSSSQDRLWAHFTQHVQFADKLLPQGDYLFVHDDDKKARGEPCLSVYRASDLTTPLASIHCVRRTLKPTANARIVWETSRLDTVKRFGHIQFPGDSYAHYAR